MIPIAGRVLEKFAATNKGGKRGQHFTTHNGVNMSTSKKDSKRKKAAQAELIREHFRMYEFRVAALELYRNVRPQFRDTSKRVTLIIHL